jgi:hypothetical protein
MADPAPVGSDVSAGRYRCTNCGDEFDTRSVKHLPPARSATVLKNERQSRVATASTIPIQITRR